MFRFPPSSTIEKNIAAVCLAALIALTLAAAFCRRLFPAAHPRLLECAAGCLVWLVSFGMARAAALGLHLRMAWIERAVSAANGRRFAVIADAFFLFFALFSFAAGCAAFAFSLARDDLPGHPVVYAGIPPGAALTAIRVFERLRGVKAEDAS